MSDSTAALICAAAAIGFLAAAWAYERLLHSERARIAEADGLIAHDTAVREALLLANPPEPLDTVDLTDLEAAIYPADIPGCG